MGEVPQRKRMFIYVVNTLQVPQAIGNGRRENKKERMLCTTAPKLVALLFLLFVSRQGIDGYYNWMLVSRGIEFP